MSLTVVGSIAFDSVKTPFGERERMLGGAAVLAYLLAARALRINEVTSVLTTVLRRTRSG